MIEFRLSRSEVKMEREENERRVMTREEWINQMSLSHSCVASVNVALSLTFPLSLWLQWHTEDREPHEWVVFTASLCEGAQYKQGFI